MEEGLYLFIAVSIVSGNNRSIAQGMSYMIQQSAKSAAFLNMESNDFQAVLLAIILNIVPWWYM